MINPFQAHSARYRRAAVSRRAAIDQDLLAFLVGLVAVMLPTIMIVAYWLPFGTCFRDTLSHFYYAPLMGSFFVGMLVFVGAYLIVYVGEDDDGRENKLATIAGIFALGVALFPASNDGCDADSYRARAFFDFMTGDQVVTPSVDAFQMYRFQTVFGEITTAHFHYASALALFFILGWFAFFVFTAVDPDQRDAQGNLTPVKALRNKIYRTSGWIIFVCLALIVIEAAYTAITKSRFPGWVAFNVTFWLEAFALWAFGTTWLVKSRFRNRALMDA